MSLLAVSKSSGLSRKVWCLFLQLSVVLCYAIPIADADITENQFQAPIASPSRVHLAAPVIPHLSLPATLPLLHKPRRKHFWPFSAPTHVVAPAQPPDCGPLITSAHPPTSPRLSKPSMKKSASVKLVDIAPVQSGDGTDPTGLAQPPLSPSASDCCKPDMVLKRGSYGCHCVYPIRLDLLLLNVSQNPNWNMFIEELATELGLLLASQLGLQFSQIQFINFYILSPSILNMSMDITPHTGISFSASDASAMNSSLALHKLHFASVLMGDYKLLNFTWFQPPAPSPEIMSEAAPRRNLAPIVAGLTSGGLVIICIGVILVLRIRGWKKSKVIDEEDVEDDHLKLVPGMPVRFSYEDLRDATNDFKERLGRGGFGSVFKGVLADETEIAVKRLENLGQAKSAFLAEVETIGTLHHFNLVRLIGFCAEKSHRLLVYEYMSNGSLDKWIFKKDQGLYLDWDTRKKIILDIAKGLAYLHDDCRQTIMHLDIKPQNILLDPNFNAKISDFGLSKLVDRDMSQVEISMRGTPGYLAPEWRQSLGCITVKVDTYSFGIVLLEVVCTRRNADRSQPESAFLLLAMLQKKAEQDRLMDIVENLDEYNQSQREEIIRMIKIGAWCLQDDPERRPLMSTVVKVLEGVMEVESNLIYKFSHALISSPVVHNQISSAPQPASVLSNPR